MFGHALNPVAKAEEVTEAWNSDAGAWDHEVSPARLQGRMDNRLGVKPADSQQLGRFKNQAVEYWHGWYDEWWGYLFGRGTKPVNYQKG